MIPFTFTTYIKKYGMIPAGKYPKNIWKMEVVFRLEVLFFSKNNLSLRISNRTLPDGVRTEQNFASVRWLKALTRKSKNSSLSEYKYILKSIHQYLIKKSCTYGNLLSCKTMWRSILILKFNGDKNGNSMYRKSFLTCIVNRIRKWKLSKSE